MRFLLLSVFACIFLVSGDEICMRGGHKTIVCVYDHSLCKSTPQHQWVTVKLHGRPEEHVDLSCIERAFPSVSLISCQGVDLCLPPRTKLDLEGCPCSLSTSKLLATGLKILDTGKSIMKNTTIKVGIILIEFRVDI